MRNGSVIGILILLLAGASGVRGETVTWTVENPPTYTPIAVDLEGTLGGISAVEVRATGYGGGQHGYCQKMSGEDLDFWLSYEVTLRLDAASGSFPAPLRADYDRSTALQAPAEGGWSFLEDGLATLTIEYDDHYEFDYVRCYPIGYEQFTVEQLTLTVTCETAVAAEPTTWGALKRIYR